MFDYIRCDRVMPDGFDGLCHEFQTKDFDWPYMERYEIRADGTLWHDVVQYDSGPSVQPGWHQIEHHGYVDFYTFDADKFHEYRAKFTDGVCVSIEYSDDDKWVVKP